MECFSLTEHVYLQHSSGEKSSPGAAYSVHVRKLWVDDVLSGRQWSHPAYHIHVSASGSALKYHVLLPPREPLFECRAAPRLPLSEARIKHHHSERNGARP